MKFRIWWISDGFVDPSFNLCWCGPASRSPVSARGDARLSGCMFFICGCFQKCLEWSSIHASARARRTSWRRLDGWMNARPCSSAALNLTGSVPAPFYHVASPDVNRGAPRKLSYCKSALWPGKQPMKAHGPKGLFAAPHLEPVKLWICAGASVVRSRRDVRSRLVCVKGLSHWHRKGFKSKIILKETRWNSQMGLVNWWGSKCWLFELCTSTWGLYKY